MTVKKLDRNATTLSIAAFNELEQLTKFNYEPPYQRKAVWSDEKQSFFIDSLLRNFPVPAVFLHRKIDPNTGSTTYDVIDGKQRLTAIKRFINNEIPASSEHAIDHSSVLLDGVYFKNLNGDIPLVEIRSAFWKYELPVEYIDPSDVEMIEDVFDRLNRNGEKLNGQELRNAKFHSTPLANAVDVLSETAYFKIRLEVTDKSRMEDKEFCAECLFSIAKNEIIGSSRKIIDELYENYKNHTLEQELERALNLSDQLNALGLNYENFKITGVSHLYGLWGVGLLLMNAGDSVVNYKVRIEQFFERLRGAAPQALEEDYRKSMASRTKEKAMRVRRVNALLATCGRVDLQIL